MSEGPKEEWESTRGDHPRFRYVCGYCGSLTGSKEGFRLRTGVSESSPVVYICGRCNRPTYFEGFGSFRRQTPAPIAGSEIGDLPENIQAIYDEARLSIQAQAHTASVLTCRKLLMHIAVEKGATEGKNFFSYVEYLSNAGYVPPDGKEWVDHIRKRGNEANHELVIMTHEDSSELLSFVEMLLRFIYEFPNRMKKYSEP